MNLAHSPSLFVDGADFPRNNKTRSHTAPHCLILYPVFVFQHVQPVLRGLQFFLQLLPPGRVGEISGSHNVDPLPPGPQIQVLRRTVLTGSPGIPGVYMKVRYVHDHSLFRLRPARFHSSAFPGRAYLIYYNMDGGKIQFPEISILDFLYMDFYSTFFTHPVTGRPTCSGPFPLPPPWPR